MNRETLPRRVVGVACIVWSLALLTWGVFWGAYGLLERTTLAGRVADPPANLDPGALGGVVVIGLVAMLLIYALRVLFVALAVLRIGSSFFLARGGRAAWEGRSSATPLLATWSILTIFFEGAILIVSGGGEPFAQFDLGFAVVLSVALLAGACRRIDPQRIAAGFGPNAKAKSLVLLDDAL